MKGANRLEDLSVSLEEIESDLMPEVESSKFRIEDLPSVWAMTESTEWVVEGFIPEGSVTLVTGDSGIGKSTLALAAAGAVAHGLPFLGRTTLQKPVLYIDGENPVSVVRERLERLHIAEMDALKLWGQWNVRAPDPCSDLVLEWAKAYRGLIIVDSLIQFHSGSEQDSADTRRYMNRFKRLAHVGASPFVLHHTGKAENSKQYRGSSDIKAVVDQAFVLEAVGEPGGGALRLKPFKERVAKVGEIHLDFSSGVFRLREGRSKTNREIVEEVIEANPNRTGRDVVKLARDRGATKSRAEEILTEGLRDGWLQGTPGPRKSILYRMRGPDD
jgi:predicted ATP-dependent serine protease